MKIVPVALFSSVLTPAHAVGFRELVEKVTRHRPSQSAAVAVDGADEGGNRELQSGCNGDTVPSAAWHPNYSVVWPEGFCTFTVDCDSPAYPTEVACCQGAYSGQVTGKCVSMLPNPPTTSPTDEGGLDVYYPDYDTAWPEAGCTNVRPLPSGRPTYTTMLACCKGAYGGQLSGVCLSMLDSPPTTSPTETGGMVDFWYPDYDTPWPMAGCSNARPLPFNNPNDRPNYPTELACCKGAYGGQMSGACLSGLPNPPTTSPTDAGGAGFWYPDYDTPWPQAGCSNARPLPFNNPNDRPNYPTELACCKGAYGGQQSGACLSGLPNPPTTSPTETGGMVDFWYPDYDTPWPQAGCSNARPLPFNNPNDRPNYPTELACCKGAYGGQQSGACLSGLPSPPTTSPTDAGGLGLFYPDYEQPWPEGVCISDRPLPSGRPTYATKDACCIRAYGGQTSLKCKCDALGVCFSCRCGTQAERDAAGCTLTCS